MNTTTHPYFVPNGDDRQETAILLVGTADEFGISQRSIRTTRTGFRITEDLARALGWVDEDGEVSGNGDPAEEPEVPAEEPEDTPVVPEGTEEPVEPQIEDEPVEEPKPKRSRKKSDTTNASGNRAGENEE